MDGSLGVYPQAVSEKLAEPVILRLCFFRGWED